ncbi:hypothetical protein [Rodentibacter genomosp. 2]|uniref:Uncharacterized protein n=1 Tax=Rodentibacter genomosp. 2 TaxID=1908266 RepID=A0A1V3JH73_9PAST|nr:hypothetical protein [Rodentibacter genomosp. 2]OOF55958.1 hypothetical protein BKK55_06625 [Rodentibacter genomosp. 2]
MTISKTPEKLTALYHQLVTKVLPYMPKEGRIHTKIEGLSFYRHDNPNYSLCTTAWYCRCSSRTEGNFFGK